MTKLQTAWLVFYYFLFVRIQEVIRQNLFLCFLFILHYFGGLQHWSVIMQKNDDAYVLYLAKLDCKSKKSQSEKALTASQFCFVFFCNSRPIMSLPWRALLCSHRLHSYLSWLSLWHSTTEKDLTAILSLTSVIICSVWCQKRPDLLWLDNSDNSNSVKKQSNDFS